MGLKTRPIEVASRQRILLKTMLSRSETLRTTRNSQARFQRRIRPRSLMQYLALHHGWIAIKPRRRRSSRRSKRSWRASVFLFSRTLGAVLVVCQGACPIWVRVVSLVVSPVEGHKVLDLLRLPTTDRRLRRLTEEVILNARQLLRSCEMFFSQCIGLF